MNSLPGLLPSGWAVPPSSRESCVCRWPLQQGSEPRALLFPAAHPCCLQHPPTAKNSYPGGVKSNCGTARKGREQKPLCPCRWNTHVEVSSETILFFSGGWAKNSNSLVWHCLYYIAFLLSFPHRAVYFACYSKAKEQFNSMFVPNSNIVHVCSAGSAGEFVIQEQRPVCGKCWKCALNLRCT